MAEARPVTRKTRLLARLNSLVMLGLLLIAFGLLAWLSNRHALEYDWTANGRHSLAQASRELLTGLPGPVEVTSYARENPLLRESIRQFVGKYQTHKDDITLRFVNPDAAPDEVRRLGIRVDGELVIRYQSRAEHVQSDNEQSFSNALRRLARGREHWLAFIEGHGERAILGAANHDLGEWGRQLLSQGYRAQPVNLGETRALPDNISVLVIAGPRAEYLPGEARLLKDYIDAGGNLLWLHDPGALHGLGPLAELLDIEFIRGVVIDSAGQMIGIDDPTIALVTGSLYAPHPITEGFDLATLFPMAAAIRAGQSETWRLKPVLASGAHTWSETGKLEGILEPDTETDARGPLTLGVSLEREIEQPEGGEIVTRQQRVVIMGDGDFLSNTYLANSGNNELGNRIINWLSNDDEFISIPPRIAGDLQLNMSGITLGVMGVGFLFILPALLIAMGVSIGLGRRKR